MRFEATIAFYTTLLIARTSQLHVTITIVITASFRERRYYAAAVFVLYPLT